MFLNRLQYFKFGATKIYEMGRMKQHGFCNSNDKSEKSLCHKTTATLHNQ